MRHKLAAILAMLLMAAALHAGMKPLEPSGAAGDQFGAAVATGDGIIAVGAYLSDLNGKDSGAVYLYRKVGTEWRLQTPPLCGEPGEWFGFDIAISGNQLVVGAPHPENGQGAVYVYNLDQLTVKKLTVPGAHNGDEIGSAVAIDDNYIVAGARGVEERKGAAYVFSSAGKYLQTLTSDPRVEKAEFGQSVALHQTMLVVGAPSPYAASHSPGAVYVSRFVGDKWQQASPLDVPAGVAEGSAFGYAVAIANQGIVVGAPLAGDKANPGKVFVFGETANLLRSGGQAGVAVAADQGSIVIGALAGTAYQCQGTSCTSLTRPPSAKGFGFGVAVHGNTVVVGAYKTGAAYVFEPETDPDPQVAFHFEEASVQGKEGKTVSVWAVLDTDRNLKNSVTATLSIKDGSDEIEIDPTEVTFGEGQKNGDKQEIKLSLLADCFNEGLETFELALTDGSGPEKKTFDTLDVKVQDGDSSAGVESTLNPPLLTDECGREEVFQVRLTCPPTSEVRVTLNSTNPAEGQVVSPSPSVLQFLPENWDQPQEVIVRGQRDGDADRAGEPYQITFALSSTDPSYNGVAPPLDFINEEDAEACVSTTADACANLDGTILYTFTMNNTASSLANQAGPELFDKLPEQVKVVAATADHGVATVDYAGNSVAWDGSIPGESTVTVQVLATLEPDVNPDTKVTDQVDQFRYGTDGKGPEAAFTVGEAEDACPVP